jgi:hypothetical protein
MKDLIGKWIGRAIARFCFVAAWRWRVWPILPYLVTVSVIGALAWVNGADERILFLNGAGAFVLLPGFMFLRRRQWFRVPALPHPQPEATVRRVNPKSFNRYVGHGIRFSYPRRWKLDDTSVKERFAVTVVSRGSALVTLTSVNPSGDGTLEGFANWYSAYLAESIERQGGGTEFGEMRVTQTRVGQDINLGLHQPFRIRLAGDDAPHVRECFRLASGIYVSLQAMEVDWPNARTGFEMVLQSLQVAPRRALVRAGSEE